MKIAVLDKARGIYWGWYVVSGVFTILSLTYGCRYSFGVFVKPMFAEYSWPMTIISVAASINLLVYASTGILIGWLLDKVAPRWIMTTGVVITTAGFVAASFVRTPAGLYLSYGLLCGMGAACSGMVACGATVGKWFSRKRGLAMGISSMGIGVGTMIMAPLSGYLVKSAGWRDGFLWIGLLTFAIGIAVSQTFMGKRGPESHGLLPDGDIPDPGSPDQRSAAPATDNISIGPVLSDRRFWLLALCNVFSVMTVMMTFVHQIPYAVNMGVDKIQAATAVGIIGMTGSIGKFFFGWLSDRVRDAKVAASMGFFVMAAGMLALYQTRSLTGLILFALIYGFGYGSLAPVIPYLVSDRFGSRILGTAYGLIIFFATGVGGAMGPIVGGIVFDSTGTYRPAWLFNALVLLIVAVIILFLKPTESASVPEANAKGRFLRGTP